MNNLYKKYWILLLVVCVGFACDSEEDLLDDIRAETPAPTDPEDPTGSTGTADLSNYVAIGNSLTAGFNDGALHPEGQAFSYPSLLARQFGYAGGGDFAYPVISSGNGFGGVDGSGAAIGRRFIDLETALAALAGVEGVEVADAIQTTPGSFLNPSAVTGSGLNNFGVPGARLVDLAIPGYGAANIFYGNFQSSPTASILEDALSANASFFTLWIGSNDVLGYATSGGSAGEAFDPFNPSTITDPATFGAAIGATLDALSANGADGVILNIPPITLTPFFQTVTNLSGGVNLIPLEEQALVDQLNGVFNVPFPSPIEGVDPGYNTLIDLALSLTIIDQAEADARKVAWTLGANPPLITDESLTPIDLSAAIMAPPGTLVLPNLRQANPADLFPLTALGTIGSLADPDNPNSVIGVGVPVPDEFTLTLDEQTNVITAYAMYNGIIAAQVAARPNLTMVDVGPLFADIFGLVPAQAAALQLSMAAQAAADGVLGIEVDDINLVPLSLSQAELYNSVWSTDGIHPNPRGAGLITNEIISTINATYGATIPMVDILELNGIFAPL